MNLETNLDSKKLGTKLDAKLDGKVDLSKAKDTAENFGVKIFQNAEEIAQHAISDASSQLSTYSKKVMNFVRENPIVAVGAVTVAGLVIARMLKSSETKISAKM